MTTQRTSEVDCRESTIEAECGDRKGVEFLDWYDRMLVQTFPASDALPLWD